MQKKKKKKHLCHKIIQIDAGALKSAWMAVRHFEQRLWEWPQSIFLFNKTSTHNLFKKKKTIVFKLDSFIVSK